MIALLKRGNVHSKSKKVKIDAKKLKHSSSFFCKRVKSCYYSL